MWKGKTLKRQNTLRVLAVLSGARLCLCFRCCFVVIEKLLTALYLCQEDIIFCVVRTIEAVLFSWSLELMGWSQV